MKSKNMIELHNKWVSFLKISLSKLPPNQTSTSLAIVLGKQRRYVTRLLHKYQITYEEIGLSRAHSPIETKRKWVDKIKSITDAKDLSVKEIGQKLDKSPQFINSYLFKYRIPIKDVGCYRLRDRKGSYWAKRLKKAVQEATFPDVLSVANIIGVSSRRVREILRYYGISPKSIGIIHHSQHIKDKVPVWYKDKESELKKIYPEIYAQLPSRHIYPEKLKLGIEFSGELNCLKEKYSGRSKETSL